MTTNFHYRSLCMESFQSRLCWESVPITRSLGTILSEVFYILLIEELLVWAKRHWEEQHASANCGVHNRTSLKFTTHSTSLAYKCWKNQSGAGWRCCLWGCCCCWWSIGSQHHFITTVTIRTAYDIRQKIVFMWI